MKRYQSLYEAKETYGIDLGMMYKVPEYWFGHGDKAIVPGKKVVEMIKFFLKELQPVNKDQIKPVGRIMPKEFGKLPTELMDI